MKVPNTKVADLPRVQLEAMAEAGAQVLECYRVLMKTDANIVGEVLREPDEFFEWDHYPEGDVYDFETHSQYYYHAHPPEGRAKKFGAEHGHFHTFLRPKGMPDGVKPVDLPDLEKPKSDNDALTHFIGISMNRSGYPIRLFTTNRWVTGETWYAADSVIGMLDRFDMDQAWPSWPANLWLTNMMRLFEPQIEALLRQRDVSVTEWQAGHPGVNAYEDRDLELTSLMDISVETQITDVEKALNA